MAFVIILITAVLWTPFFVWYYIKRGFERLSEKKSENA